MKMQTDVGKMTHKVSANSYHLNGKTALVTGGSNGIGAEIAKTLARNGASVAIAYSQDKEAASAVVDAVKEAGSKAVALQCNVSDSKSVERLSQSVTENFDKLDILVNCAGIVRDELLLSMNDESWYDVIQTNLTGTFLVTRACVPGMIRNRWGRIINMSSIAGEFGSVGQTNYAASKGGINAMTKSLALEVASKGVTVNAIAPGMIETRMSENVRNLLGENLKKQIPLGRFGKPEDIAECVAWMSSSAADYITGQIITIDGGISLNRRR